MDALKRWWNGLTAGEMEERPLLQPGRVRLFYWLLVLDLALSVFFGLRELRSGAGGGLNPLFNGLGMVVFWFLLRRFPGFYPGLIRLFLFFTLAAIAAMPGVWSDGYLAPSLLFMTVLCFFGLVLDGPRMSLVLLGFEAALFFTYVALVPPADLRAEIARSNLLLGGLAFFAIGWAAWRQFRGLTHDLMKHSSVLYRLHENCDHLLKSVFEVLETQVEELKVILEWGASRSQAGRQADSILKTLKDLKQTSLPTFEENSLPDGYALMTQARLALLRAFTDLWLGFHGIVILRNLWFYRLHQETASILVLTLLLGFRWIIHREKTWANWMAWSFLGALMLGMVPPLLFWDKGSLPPGLVGLPAIILATTLVVLDWRGPALAGMAGYLGLLEFLYFFRGPVPDSQVTFFLGLAALAPVVLMAGWFFWQLREGLLTRLREQDEKFRRSLRVRQRLLGAMLHDLNNPLFALRYLIEDAQEPGSLELRQMTARMDQILRNSREFLAAGVAAPPERLRPISWEKLARNLLDLFRERLKLKSLELRVEGGKSLAILGLPELLCDSVLANLLSNALKFSPRGSAIELSCEAQGEGLLVRVADRGPGLPPGILEAFQRGERLTSGVGSEGETGTGLGLLLARDYARFMGGDLRLRPREGGGTEALLTLMRQA
ncbi:MAG TPA: HAMP domain-containing sensor histidine kinase [bacterium]|nr:HAMP domain-containing sensor histidine kinase [bacterium]